LNFVKLLTLAAIGGIATSAFAALSFSGPSNFPTGIRPAGIASGDFDNDGDFDFAVAVDDPDRVSVYFNNGSGGFAGQVSYQTGSNTGPDALIADDLDRDGDLDLAVTLHNVNQVRTLFNNGLGTFAFGPTAAVGANPIDIVAGDFGGSAARDLATCNRDGNTVSVLIDNGSGYTVSSVATQLEPREIAVGDFDGDNDDDLFVTNHDSRSISFLRNTGGSFINAQSYGVHPSTRPEGISAADLDGDFDLDLGVALSDDGISFLAVFKNNGNGTLGAASNFVTGGLDADAVAFGDFDHDGDADAAISNNGTNNASFMENNGTGGFGAPTLLPTGTYPEWVQVFDIDSDGSLDVAVSNRDSNNISFYLNNNQNSGSLVNSITMDAGSIVSGNLQSLLASDNNRLVMRPGVVLISNQAPIRLVVSGQAPGRSASAIRFTLEASASFTFLSQEVEMFDFAIGDWESVDVRAATVSDSTIVIDVTLNSSRFVDPATGEVRAKLSWKANTLNVARWNAMVDFVRWVITP
jgi:hypothetical protein